MQAPLHLLAACGSLRALSVTFDMRVPRFDVPSPPPPPPPSTHARPPRPHACMRAHARTHSRDVLAVGCDCWSF